LEIIMTDETQYTVQDLIAYSYDQKPVEFENAFSSLMIDRIAAAVDNKKIEVAQAMFSDETEEEVVDQEEVDTEVETVDQETEEEENGETA